MVMGTKEGLLLVVLIFYGITFTVLGLVPYDWYSSSDDVATTNLYESNLLGSEEAQDDSFTWFDGLKVANLAGSNPVGNIGSGLDEVDEKISSGEGFFATIIINLSNAPAVLNIILFTPLFIVLMFIIISALPFFGGG